MAEVSYQVSDRRYSDRKRLCVCRQNLPSAVVGGAVTAAFAIGWVWRGLVSLRDYQHFSANGGRGRLSLSTFESKGDAWPGRIDVQAMIYSDTHSPDEISAQLGLQPTETTNKGIRIGPRTGTPSNIPHNFWMLSSESNVAVLEFSDHLDWMLSRLLPVRDRLIDLRDSGAILKFVLTCVIWTNNDGAVLTLSIRQAEALVHLQADLGFQFADYGEENDPGHAQLSVG